MPKIQDNKGYSSDNYSDPYIQAKSSSENKTILQKENKSYDSEDACSSEEAKHVAKTSEMVLTAAGSPELPLQEPSSASEAFSMILESVGSDGRWQWYLFFVTAFGGNLIALHNLGAVFLAAEPDHWCAVPGLQHFSNSTQARDMRNASIPWEEGSDGVARYSRCRYYVRDYEEVISLLPPDPSAPVLAPPLDTNTTTCSSWHYDRSLYTNTVVSEWNLVCEDRWLMSSAQASYMAGFMVGALVLSELADKYGRRTLLLWSTLLFTVTTIATYFSTSYLMFITFRFFVAAFGSGVFLSNYVILMESLGLHSRTLFGVLYHIFFTTGICILALLGYLYRDWRDLQLASSLPTILLLSYYFLTPESPRWLMMEGRHEEALVILRRMAKFNRGSLPQQQQLQLYIDVIDRERHKKYAPSSFKEKCFWFMQSQLTLVRTPNMRRRCLITFFAWFVISMIYYGLAFNGGNLNLPPYVLMTTNGVVEFVACFSTIWILNVCGRRLSLCILLVVCGVACLVIVFIPVELSWVNMVLSSVGRFFIAPGFTVVFMYSVELVPTHVRNVAIGTSSMCARIGSGIAPYIVDLLGAVHYAVPSTVFGGFAVTAGLLSLLLPETGKQRLPESIKEIEAMPR